MNILVITQMFSQPDDVGDNKPTKTVNYFVKEWNDMGNNVIVMHCPSKFPIVLYLLPNFVKNIFARRISTMVPPIESRKQISRFEHGAKVFRLPLLKLWPGQGYSSAQLWEFSKKLKRILDNEDFVPDVVIGHFANPSLELVANLSEIYKAKSSIVFHHDCNENNIIKYRINKNIRRIGAVGARSVLESYEVKRLLSLEKDPFVCYSGVPNEAVLNAKTICDKQNYKNGIRYIFVGSLIKRKHLDVVIKAFVRVCHDEDSLIVVGGGPEESALKKLVNDLNANDSITFLGRISREEVLKEMSSAHVFTLISDSETYGMVYVEAMLQGCITIASKGGGFDGIIEDGVNGFLCEPGNQSHLEEIYTRIRKLSTEEKNRIGQAAIDTAIHFSEREVAEKYLNDVIRNQR